jgi:Domain of unknown function (DUF397)
MDHVTWRKATRSSSNGGVCVEIARLGSDSTGIRDSKNPHSGHLTIGRQAAQRFLNAIKAGRYDL